jgi:ribosome recycling factor
MNTSELKSRLEKSIEFLRSELNQIRTGRVSPSLISDIQVEAYPGSFMTIKEVGSINVMDPHNLAVLPWDKSVLESIVSAIKNSDLGVSAIQEADRVRVSVPSLTEERRVEFAKDVSEKVEDSKNAMRNIRQEAMKDIDKEFADKVITEDEKFRQRDSTEEIIKDFVDKADEMGEEKKKEIMTV